jgi:hypothetical protein
MKPVDTPQWHAVSVLNNGLWNYNNSDHAHPNLDTIAMCRGKFGHAYHLHGRGLVPPPVPLTAAQEASAHGSHFTKEFTRLAHRRGNRRLLSSTTSAERIGCLPQACSPQDRMYRLLEVICIQGWCAMAVESLCCSRACCVGGYERYKPWACQSGQTLYQP